MALLDAINQLIQSYEDGQLIDSGLVCRALRVDARAADSVLRLICGTTDPAVAAYSISIDDDDRITTLVSGQQLSELKAQGRKLSNETLVAIAKQLPDSDRHDAALPYASYLMSIYTARNDGDSLCKRQLDSRIGTKPVQKKEECEKSSDSPKIEPDPVKADADELDFAKAFITSKTKAKARPTRKKAPKKRTASAAKPLFPRKKSPEPESRPSPKKERTPSPQLPAAQEMDVDADDDDDDIKQTKRRTAPKRQILDDSDDEQDFIKSDPDPETPPSSTGAVVEVAKELAETQSSAGDSTGAVVEACKPSAFVLTTGRKSSPEAPPCPEGQMRTKVVVSERQVDGEWTTTTIKSVVQDAPEQQPKRHDAAASKAPMPTVNKREAKPARGSRKARQQADGMKQLGIAAFFSPA